MGENDVDDDLDVSHISMHEEGDSILVCDSNESYVNELENARVIAPSQATRRSHMYGGGEDNEE
jgi:hypothetical protein